MKKKIHQLTLLLITISSSLFISSCAGDNDPGQSTENSITTFMFAAVNNTSLTKDVIGSIDIDTNIITFNVPYDADITTLQPTVRIPKGATINPEATPQDFSTPVIYTVTASAGNTLSYEVIVNVTRKPDDVNALIAIYNANPQAQAQLGWDITRPDLASNWNGVNMEGNRVTMLNLNNIDYYFLDRITVIPYEIKYLTALKKLDITYTDIEKLPKEMGRLTALEELNASRSLLTTLPISMGELTKFNYLNIRGLGNFNMPKEICDLEKLGQLTIKASLNPLSSYCL